MQSERSAEVDLEGCSDEAMKRVGPGKHLASVKTECSRNGSVADILHSKCVSALLKLTTLSHHILF